MSSATDLLSTCEYQGLITLKRYYHIYPKYLDPSTPYHTCSKI